MSGADGGRGTISIVGTHLTFTKTAECNGGVEGGPGNGETFGVDFTARSPDRLILFITEGTSVTEEVFLSVSNACTAARDAACPRPATRLRVERPPCECAALVDGTITNQCSI